MSATVLGKRSRHSVDVDDLSPRSTRAKKRAIESTATAVCSLSKVRGKSTSITGASCPRARPDALKTSPLALPKKCSPLTQKAVEIYQDENHEPTPQTPRHRDSQSKKVLVTPRHRLFLPGAQGTPLTPRTPTRASTAVYNQARELFSRSSNPGRLIGREHERTELIDFIEQHLRLKHGGCLYVSGPPGTGKSALLHEVQKEFRGTATMKIATINCMSVQTAEDLRTKIETELELPSRATKTNLQSFFTKDHASALNLQYLLVLDEIDRLLEVNQDLLYSIFEWSMMPESNLILIGIANALDLTDRCLPKLRSRGLKPDLLPFMPYSAAQIANVLTSKLNTLGSTAESNMPPFLHPAAIQFCAKKVAAQTGDLRKAFDICRRAIDLVEKETLNKDIKQSQSPTKTPLMENINLSSPLTPHSPSKSPDKREVALPIYTVTTAPRATIAHIAKITAQAFSNGSNQRLTSLNLQQKAVLCSLAALEQRKQAAQLNRTMYDTPSKTDRSAPSVKQLCDAYILLCKQSEMLQPLSTLEFRDVVSGLEAQALITGANGKGGSFATPITPSRTPSRKLKAGFAAMPSGDDRRVASVVGHKELEACLHGPGGELLRDILDGNC